MRQEWHGRGGAAGIARIEQARRVEPLDTLTVRVPLPNTESKQEEREMTLEPDPAGLEVLNLRLRRHGRGLAGGIGREERLLQGVGEDLGRVHRAVRRVVGD